MPTDYWIEVAPKLGAETTIYPLAVFNNKLYGGTYPNGKLYEWNGVDAWIEVAPKLGAETDISSLAVFNNELYGGTYPNGKLYKWSFFIVPQILPGGPLPLHNPIQRPVFKPRRRPGDTSELGPGKYK